MTPEERAQLVGDLAAWIEDLLDEMAPEAAMQTVYEIMGEAIAAAFNNNNDAARALMAALKADPGTAEVIRKLMDGRS